ncbi:MAG: choice-of-anchor Q domain-containing protein, partial [Pirellulales bacterium]
TDNGSTWLGLGTVSTSNARFLAADAGTRLFFQPNANYSGTMAAAITFHAWDQTSGSNRNVLDQFTTASYGNNDGTANWTGSWVENDSNGGGASGGRIQVNGGELDIRADTIGDWIYREADLSAATSAVLSLNYNNSLGSGDSIVIQVSSDGGTIYNNLPGGTFSTSLNTGAGSLSFDISTFIAANTRIRFYVASQSANEHLYLDNVQITLTTDGGTSVSTASDTASLTVNAVNDRPVRTAGTVSNLTVPEDSGLTTLGLGALAYGPGGGVDEAGQTLVYKVTAVPATALGNIVLSDGATVVTANTNYSLAQLQGMQFRTANNANGGPATFTWSVQDSGGTGNGGLDTLTESLTVTVSPVNDPPTITAIANTIILESGNIGALAFTVGDLEAAAGSLTVTATSSNQTIIPDANLVVAGSGANKTITVTPAVGQSGGPVTITVTVSDGVDQSQELFDVTVVPRVITVTTLADEDDGDTSDILTLLATPGGTGISLREAIIAANNTNIGATPDQIILPSGDYLLNLGNLEKLDDGLLITGGGARTTTIDARGLHRVFEIDGNSIVTMTNLTIQGGDDNNGGGAYVNGGSTLNLTDVRMTGNESSNSGGAIHVHGTLNLNRVLLDNNTAPDGGALGFHGADGGSLTNVTISGNTATGDGGAIHTDSVIFITNSTIANNTGATVGGIFIAGGNVVLANSILDNNGANANASLTSGGYNIASDATASLTGSGDQVIDTLLFPFLNPLDNYGGPTDTHAPIGGSPTQDPTGLTGAPALDQRGIARDAFPDIGAFEGTIGSLIGPISDTDAAADQVAENAATGTAVGITALATDPDAGDSVTYMLTDDAGGRFAIHATTGVVTVADGSLLDFENATSHNIMVRVTSSDTSSSTRVFTINVLPQNDLPTANNDSGTGFVTDEDTGFTTGNVLANDTDPDTSDILTVLSIDTTGTLGLVT